VSDSDLVTAESWLERHPYLEPVGRLHGRVEEVLAGLTAPDLPVPGWDAYLDDFLGGVPVLGSSSVAVDLAPAGTLISALIERLAPSDVPGPAVADVGVLGDELRRDLVTADRLAAWLTGDDPFSPSHPGLLRYLGWTGMAHYLAPVAKAFAAWRDEERWMRRYCPLCGSSPAMAQLIGKDPGRRRVLACGCCGTRWRFRRTECPFCENDSHRLASVAFDGEAGLRIDWCEACKGYIKTYDGEGNERVLLSDWSSLHLDVIALDRGLSRTAVSLYELPPG